MFPSHDLAAMMAGFSLRAEEFDTTFDNTFPNDDNTLIVTNPKLEEPIIIHQYDEYVSGTVLEDGTIITIINIGN